MVIADYLNIIETFAEKNNIIAGVCHAAPMDSGWLSASPFVPFVSADLQKRTDPSATLTGVKSIIVIGVAPQGEGLAPAGNSQSGQLSSLGVDSDYHVVVRGLLRELVDELKTLGAFRYKILVDGSGLDERALAERAGLGFFGRNGLIISEKFGSRFNIGCVLTDLELPPNLKSQSFFVEGGSGGDPFFSKKGSPPEVFSEKVILGLRLTNGVVEKEFSAIYEKEIAKLIKDGLLERKQDRLCLTEKGMDFANQVFTEFIR